MYRSLFANRGAVIGKCGLPERRFSAGDDTDANQCAQTCELQGITAGFAEKDGLGGSTWEVEKENLRKQIALPWMSFGSDAGSMSPAAAASRIESPRKDGVIELSRFCHGATQ